MSEENNVSLSSSSSSSAATTQPTNNITEAKKILDQQRQREVESGSHKEEEKISDFRNGLDRRLFMEQQISENFKVMVVPTEYAFRLGDILSPTLYIYRPSYEGLIVLYGRTYGKKDVDRYQMPANFTKLIELADRKARIITKYKRSEVVVNNTAAWIFALISILTATKELLNVFQNSEKEKLEINEIMAYAIVVIGLWGTYLERTRGTTMRLMIEDLQAIASNIDSIGSMFLNNFEQNNPQQQNGPPFLPRTEEDASLASVQPSVQGNMNLAEKDFIIENRGLGRGYPSYHSTSSSRPQGKQSEASLRFFPQPASGQGDATSSSSQQEEAAQEDQQYYRLTSKPGHTQGK
jgi:hypothetical protein